MARLCVRWAALKAGLAAGLVVWASSLAAAAPPPPPSQVYGPLFRQVELEPVFPDSKTFADAVPRKPAAQIMRLYRAQRPRTPAALRQFVLDNFSVAQGAAARTPAVGGDLQAHIDGLWDVLTRQPAAAPPGSSLLPLPEKYVVPGGRFQEMYYWDSYFTMLGLQRAGRRDLIADMVRDFAFEIDRYGYIPNGDRSYYLGRSQPPVFFEMVALDGGADEAAEDRAFLPELKREYAFWMAGAEGLKPGQARGHVVRLPDGTLLNRYWGEPGAPRDESYREDVALAARATTPAPRLYHALRGAAESGWDFSSRWFADGRRIETIDTGEIAPVDLNSLMFGLEQAISRGCERAGQAACAQAFTARAERRRTAVERYMWRFDVGAPGLGSYGDLHWPDLKPTDDLTPASLYPLFVGLASADHAGAVAQTVGRTLLQPGGLVTSRIATGQQWDWPNGWAPLQWIGVAGLRRYGQDGLAQTVACRWLVNVNRVYVQTGRLVEKYDVVDADKAGGGGEYPTQDGFGWTNGVTSALIGLYAPQSKAWLDGRAWRQACPEPPSAASLSSPARDSPATTIPAPRAGSGA